MLEIETLNHQLYKEFLENSTYHTLERYVMSELLSPIEDYMNAILIIENNMHLIDELNLYYIATYLSIEWQQDANKFLRKLNDMINKVSEKDKAIIYYLNAYYISYTSENIKTNELYRIYLLKSIKCSKNIAFVNNRYDYSKITDDTTSKFFLEEAAKNVVLIETEDSLLQKPMDYWLSSHRFVREFILGTHITEEAYNYKFR